MSAPVEVDLHGFAHGGEAVGRLPDGRVVFVAYGIPGERVSVEITEDHKRWTRARLVEVVAPSADRVEPPCPYFGPGACGGCRLQHIAPPRRRVLQRQVVVDQLQRLGRIPDPPVADMVAAGDYGYRNRARFGVTPSGALGFRRAQSTELLPIDRCLLLDEATQALREATGDGFAGAAEVEVRTATTGSAVVVDPSGSAALAAGDGELRHTVGGLTYEVSPTSFFQSNTAGAEILLRLVRAGADIQRGDSALDLYAGVGLFAKGLAADGATVTAVEGTASSAADAQRNLGPTAQVIAAPVERTLPRMLRQRVTFDVVVLDPPRRGAGKDVTGQVAALASRSIVIVACDPAALGRDAGILRERGWSLAEAAPVDQFAQTGHIEVVATFSKDT